MPAIGEHEHEAAADRAVGDPLDAEQRRVDVQLVDRERREPREAADPADVRLDRSPAGGVRLGDPVDDRGEAGGGEGCACEVEAAPARLLRVSRDDLQRGDEQDCGDGEVDVEDRPPVGELGEDAADEDADRRARSADCTPGGERLRALRARGRHEVMIESAAGERIAAPSPWPAREAKSIAALPAIAEANEEAVKTPRPVRNMRRRPRRSAARPPKSRRLPKISE